MEPIRDLAKDKVPFTLGPEHQKAFIQMKKEIASAPASKVLVLIYYKIQNQHNLQARFLQMPRKAMLWLSWNYLQWLGQWRSSTIFFMPVIFCLKQIRNCLKPYYPTILIKLQQDCREYLLEHLHTILQ